jgi:hypothetical protein
MKSDRIFYSTTAVLILAIMFIGFQEFFISGHGHGGRIIDAKILPTVVVHGVAVTAWYVLFLVQALLIAGKNRRLHMKLGWVSALLVPLIAVSGIMVAIRSAQGAPATFAFFGMPYRSQFTLIMLTEIVFFTLCLVAGMYYRKRSEVHRGMMLTASLSLLLGATARMPWLSGLFGGDTPTGFFGPVFALGAGLVLVSSLLRRKFDRPLAAGYSAIVVTYLLAAFIGTTNAWQHLAIAVLK